MLKKVPARNDRNNADGMNIIKSHVGIVWINITLYSKRVKPINVVKKSEMKIAAENRSLPKNAKNNPSAMMQAAQ